MNKPAKPDSHTTAITMRELQKLSASTIEALPHAVPIKSGNRVVGHLVPIQKADQNALDEIASDSALAAVERTAAENDDLEAAFQLVESGYAEDLLTAMAEVARRREMTARLESYLAESKSARASEEFKGRDLARPSKVSKKRTTLKKAG